jgi:hypothetical protein
MSSSLALAPDRRAATATRPIDIAVSCIKNGKIGRGTIQTRLPEFAAGKTWFEAGPLRQHAPAAVADCQEIVARCAPWLVCFIGPELWTKTKDNEDLTEYSDSRQMPDGGLAVRILGQAYFGRDTIFVSISKHSHPGVLSTLHHEIWHALEKFLTPGALAAVDSLAAGGRARPSEYLSSLSERRARLYQNLAASWDEGAMIRLADADLAMRAMWHVYSGGLAKDVIAARARAASPPNRGIFRRLFGF